FFQAEDGIRDFHVTGVQTCALPICSPRPAAPAPRVVIVGGGFGGVGAARRFERLNMRGHRIDVTLISDSNYLLFTPMLAEVASEVGRASCRGRGQCAVRASGVPSRW